MGFDIIEMEAENFRALIFDSLYDYGNKSVRDVKDKIVKELKTFSRNEDRLVFLQHLQKKVAERIEILRMDKLIYNDEILIFVINEQIDDLRKKVGKAKQDTFTRKEQIEMHRKIDEILERLKSTNAGQEVLFDEIEELKYQTLLGKKGFRQLLTGKLMEMVASSLIDKSIGTEIYNGITKEISKVKGVLD